MFRHDEMDHRQLISWTVANQDLNNPPGEKYAYSNFGFCIVGWILEKVTRQPYDAFVRERILRPCGIEDMRIAGNTRSERAPSEVGYYDPDRESPYRMNVRRMDSHGGWIASATDLVRFAIRAAQFPGAARIPEARTAARNDDGERRQRGLREGLGREFGSELVAQRQSARDHVDYGAHGQRPMLGRPDERPNGEERRRARPIAMEDGARGSCMARLTG